VQEIEDMIPAVHGMDLSATDLKKAEAEGMGYQTMINAALREAVTGPKGKSASEKPLTAATLRKILREELQAA